MSAALPSDVSPIPVPESGEPFASLWDSVRRGVYRAPVQAEATSPEPARAAGDAPTGDEQEPAAPRGAAPAPAPAEGDEAGQSQAEPDYKALYEGLSKELSAVRQRAEAGERAEARAREVEERAKQNEARLSEIDRANRQSLEARIQAEPDPQKKALAQAALALHDEKQRVEAAKAQNAEDIAGIYREKVAALRSQVGLSLDQFAEQFPAQEGVHVSAEELRHFVNRKEIREAVAKIANPQDIAPIVQAVHLFAVERSEANLAANQAAAAGRQTFRSEETPAAQSGQTKTERLASMPDDNFSSLWENVKRNRPTDL